jgi:multisubunit Na+/H+ antiporter MnhB subunit
LPVLVLTAGYLLWAGGKAPGGAFQAGALLGAGVVVMVLAGARVPPGWAGTPGRLALTGGLGLFLAAGALPLAGGGQLLEYPAGQAGAWILLIEAASALSIGAVLGLLFIGGRPRQP